MSQLQGVLDVQSNAFDNVRDAINRIAAASNQLSQVRSRINSVTEALSAWGEISAEAVQNTILPAHPTRSKCGNIFCRKLTCPQHFCCLYDVRRNLCLYRIQ